MSLNHSTAGSGGHELKAVYYSLTIGKKSLNHSTAGSGGHAAISPSLVIYHTSLNHSTAGSGGHGWYGREDVPEKISL